MKKHISTSALLFAVLGSVLLPDAAGAAVRERLPFNADWYFQKSDPTGIEGKFDYAKVKDRIMQTGLERVQYRAADFQQPQGDPRKSTTYAQSNGGSGQGPGGPGSQGPKVQ